MGGKQLSFADALSDPRLGANRRLEAIGAAIDWAPLAALSARLRPGRTGRPPYEPLVMLKALLLQRLYALSDPQLEEALFDRLSFRRFCGFAAGEGAPDETTLCRFRQDAAESGVLEACLDEVNRQLAAKGLMLKTGTLIDATIIAAKSRKPEPAAGLGAQVPSEPDADWTKKNGRSHFGYRLHAGVDEGSGLIRRLVLTPARVNESLVADDLICGDERAVYGDKGYESKERRARLKARGIKDRIMHRSHKNQAALPRGQARRNALIARRRAAVERVFRDLEAPARARPRPLLDPCPQPRRHDRLRDRPQPAPRRRPYPGLKTSRSPNAAAAPQSRAPDPAAATAGSRLIRLAPANPSVSQRSPEGEVETASAVRVGATAAPT
jgi:IS5 family transposase